MHSGSSFICAKLNHFIKVRNRTPASPIHSTETGAGAAATAVLSKRKKGREEVPAAPAASLGTHRHTSWRMATDEQQIHLTTTGFDHVPASLRHPHTFPALVSTHLPVRSFGFHFILSPRRALPMANNVCMPKSPRPNATFHLNLYPFPLCACQSVGRLVGPAPRSNP